MHCAHWTIHRRARAAKACGCAHAGATAIVTAAAWVACRRSSGAISMLRPKRAREPGCVGERYRRPQLDHCVPGGFVAVDADKALDYQRALATFTLIAAESETVQGLLQNTTAQVSRVTHIRHVKVLRYRPDRGDLLIEAGVGWKPGVVGHVTIASDHSSPPGRSMQTGTPVVIEDLPNDPEYRCPEVLREHGIVSVVNVPVFVSGKHWGVLEVDSMEKTSFDDYDTYSLSIFANILGLSLAQRLAEAEAVAAASKVAKSRSQTDFLLRELQHRMKNNLQVIASFLALQRRQATG